MFKSTAAVGIVMLGVVIAAAGFPSETMLIAGALTSFVAGMYLVDHTTPGGMAA